MSAEQIDHMTSRRQRRYMKRLTARKRRRLAKIDADFAGRLKDVVRGWVS